MDFENLDIFEVAGGPQSLFEYIRRYVLLNIEGFDISSEAKLTMNGEYFSYFDIFKHINDFVFEDWNFVGVLLNSWDYSLAYIILSKVSFDDRKEYRIAISGDPLKRSLDNISINGYGPLFKRPLDDHHQLEAVNVIYRDLLRSRDANLKPIRRLLVERTVDSEHEPIYLVKEKNVFFSTIGPSSLFKYAKIEASKNRNNLENLDPNFVNLFLKQFPELYIHFSPLIGNKWVLEAVFLEDTFSIGHVLFFHCDNTRLHLLVDGQYRVQELFFENIIYENLLDPTRQEFFEKTMAFYEPQKAIISPIIENEPLLESTVENIENEIVEVDPYFDFKANFAGKTILVIGPSHLSQDMMNQMARDLFLPNGAVDYRYDDYTKLTGKSFEFLRGQQKKYLGIILGPNPHKMYELGKYPSLASKLKQDPAFPFTIEAVSNTQGKNLKITKSSFSHALFEIMRHALAS